MKKASIIILFIIPFFTFAQSEKQASKKIASEFKKFYNLEAYQEVFNLFSPEMKAALPLDKTNEFFKGIKSQAGKIKHLEFIKYINGSFASYKTDFENGFFSIDISVDSSYKINGFMVKPYKENTHPKLVRNTSKLILPFKGEWDVVWGGDTKELNYHVEHPAQKNAFDMVIRDQQGKSYRTDGLTNEDYYAFGKELIAPTDAEVVLVVDGIKDNIPGEMNAIYIPGNTVILKTVNNEYLFFAHFKQHSIVVKQGQKIKQGELLGLCGNSGNSSEAHLHFHIQNTEDMNHATGAKSYFSDILVNGELKKEYSPIQGQKVKNQ
ncbi:peptidase M23 [Polaribacter pacificus]|uniref:Peptidase M23 n=1 Tax=Polaribacter pacificus TaxID=1775173 RepID=A0A917MDS2_9FLAO|nr:DUF3887 domain-containing protein [Polaribacter pacificus]GGG97740.1 peptidase M23 [Polaribacter pacificus]